MTTQPPPLCPTVQPPDSPNPESDPGAVHALVAMLKTPAALVRRIEEDRDLPGVIVQLFVAGLLCHAIYGFAMALFDSPATAAVTSGKSAWIGLTASLLCLPSLYVFSCVGGLPITLRQAAALAAATVAMTGLLLLGLTPVSWLFSVSTGNLAFIVITNAIAWFIAIVFVFRFFRHLNLAQDFGRSAGIRWWLCIYVVVTLQMATVMRPLLGPAPAPADGAREKKFFIAHFLDAMKTPPPPAGARPAPRQGRAP